MPICRCSSLSKACDMRFRRPCTNYPATSRCWWNCICAACCGRASLPIWVRKGAFPSARKGFSGITKTSTDESPLKNHAVPLMLFTISLTLGIDTDARSFDDTVARNVLLARQFHALLFDESTKQRVHRFHDAGIAVDFEKSMLFDCSNALILDVSGDYARESTP